MRSTPLALALVSFFAPLAAQEALPSRQPIPEIGEQGRRPGAWLAQQLELSPEQRQQMKALAQKHRGEFQARRQAMRERQLALRQALADPATSPEQLRRLYDQVSEQRYQNLMARRGMRQELEAVLNPEQRERLHQLQAERRARRG